MVHHTSCLGVIRVLHLHYYYAKSPVLDPTLQSSPLKSSRNSYRHNQTSSRLRHHATNTSCHHCLRTCRRVGWIVAGCSRRNITRAEGRVGRAWVSLAGDVRLGVHRFARVRRHGLPGVSIGKLAGAVSRSSSVRLGGVGTDWAVSHENQTGSHCVASGSSV